MKKLFTFLAVSFSLSSASQAAAPTPTPTPADLQAYCSQKCTAAHCGQYPARVIECKQKCTPEQFNACYGALSPEDKVQFNPTLGITN